MKKGVDLKTSSLLSREEHNTLHHLLGPKCQSLATTIVQLFLTEAPDHAKWRRKDAGVLCFVKDHTRRSYFFRLYCLTRRNLVWEHEVYNDMPYTAPRIWLHTFEAENAMAAFNFASDDEAESFKYVVDSQLAAKKQRRNERRSRALGSNDAVPGSMPNLPTATATTMNGPSYNKHHRSTSSGGAVKRKEKDSKKKIKKEDIGLPQDFRHVSHVGWDPNKGFEVGAIEDPTIRAFFDRAGVSENQLKDHDTRQFIYDFINQNGGIDAVKEDITTPSTPIRAPPVPSRAPPPPSATSKPAANQPSSKPSPPRPPSSFAQPRTAPPTPAPQQRIAPPPPPPPSMLPKQTAPQETRSPAPAIPGAPVPPPPPPPPMSDPAVSPPPPPQDSRSALLAAIKSGPTLKHVEVNKRTESDSRGRLMDQIREGIELKSVQPIERTTGPTLPAEGLAGALARALAERNRAFNNDSNSESDSSSGDTDSEWEE